MPDIERFPVAEIRARTARADPGLRTFLDHVGRTPGAESARS
jgi:hypothetical protein